MKIANPRQPMDGKRIPQATVAEVQRASWAIVIERIRAFTGFVANAVLPDAEVGARSEQATNGLGY